MKENQDNPLLAELLFLKKHKEFLQTEKKCQQKETKLLEWRRNHKKKKIKERREVIVQLTEGENH